MAKKQKKVILPRIESNVDVDTLKKMGVSLVALLDTTRPNKNNKYAIRMRIIINKDATYYTTKQYVTRDEFYAVAGAIKPGESRVKPAKGQLKVIRNNVEDLLEKASDIIVAMGGYFPSEFKSALKGEGNDWANVWKIFDYYIDDLRKKDRISYASTFEISKKSFEKYMDAKKRHVKEFDRITVEWLEGYEAWALSKSKTKKPMSISTIGINTRNLRVLYNLAIKKGGATRNPFKDYKPPTSENIKKALSTAEILAIGKYQTESEYRRYYRDLFLFSYLGSGMNLSDVFRLQYKNIVTYTTSQGEKREYISYTRKKTSTKRVRTKRTTPLTPVMRKIIETWGNKKKTGDTLIFKALNNYNNESDRLRKIKQETKACNTHLKGIANELGLDESISSYSARHSFASHAVQSGQGVHFVQKQLGHSDSATTERYIDSLGPELLEKAMSFMDFLED